MNWGKFAAGGLVALGLLAGGAIWWLQEYAFYQSASFTPGTEILLQPKDGGAPEPIRVTDVEGIDAESSPLRFRACFITDMSAAELQRFEPYPGATPLNPPSWFSCFDADEIGHALEAGTARAYLGQRGIHPEVDRVIAILPDGRGFAWHQLQNPQ